MTSKMPRSIKVGPHHYSVRIDDVAVDKNVVADRSGGDQDAFFDAQKREIVLREKNLGASTVIHEAFHALFEMTGMDARFDSDKPPTEEEVIRSIEYTLLALIRENAPLMAYLVAP